LGISVSTTSHKKSFNENAAQALCSEALVMRIISENTSIPLPWAYRYSNTLDKEVGGPYILMDFVEGSNGQDAWFDRSTSPTTLEAQREKILRESTAAMDSLGRSTFKSSGAPDIDESGNLKDNCLLMRVVDVSAPLQKM
jgi:hypothetical protein